MISLFAFLFIFWGICLYGGQKVAGWNWPTAATLRTGAGVSGTPMTLVYWTSWLGLYLTSAIATAQAIVHLQWIMHSSADDPIVWATVAVGVPVMMYSTYCVFQDREKERSGVSEDF